MFYSFFYNMVKDLKQLVARCEQELQNKGYSTDYLGKFQLAWTKLAKWMGEKAIVEFEESVAEQFCLSELGMFLLKPKTPQKTSVRLRAIRLLVNYQKGEPFEFRSPRCRHDLPGQFGFFAEEYLEHCVRILKRSSRTVQIKRWYLHLFCTFMNTREITPATLCLKDVDNFTEDARTQRASPYNCMLAVGQFLSFLAEAGHIGKELANKVVHRRPKMNSHLPSFYTPEEVRKIQLAVEQNSALGKRDWIVLLLASEYGLRACDIRTLTFAEIDWDNNLIRHRMRKTGNWIQLPLLDQVGNAITAYLQDGRPDCETPEIIVSHENTQRGRPLSSPSIHSIVTKYIRRAEIAGWKQKKHGPHSLRFSLAYRHLQSNTEMPVISQVLGHQSMQTTKGYLKIDIEMLRKCPLPMPPLETPFYPKEK